MSVVTIYRAFRTRCHVVYERHLDDMALLAMSNADTPYVKLMLETEVTPTIFTKVTAPLLSREMGQLPWNESLEALAIVIEAYPFSYHCGAVPELGIIISFNHGFKIGKNQKQRNWKYDRVLIVDNFLRYVNLADIPKGKGVK